MYCVANSRDHAQQVSKRPSRLMPLATAMALMLALGGCASFEKDRHTVSSIPADYRTKHPIVVSQSQISEDMIVTSNMSGMSFRQLNTVNSFLGRFRRSGAQSVHVMLPAGSANEAAARRVGNDIVEHMVEERIARDRIHLSRYHASGHGDSATIRLAFDSVRAKVGSECGRWPDDLVDTHDNTNYSNFGCATQNNLAEMIANPEDLINPRGQTEIDAGRRDNVITDWRDSGTASLPSLL